MSSHTLISRVIKTEPVAWNLFAYIQQEDFKDWTPEAKSKLKASILANEFTQPFYVWQDPSSNVIYCLDGRHRTLILEELLKEGHQIPELLPATFINCENKKEAAELVLIYSSLYAKVTETGLFDFMKAYELDYSQMKMTIDIPELDTIHFEGMFKDKDLEREHIVSRLSDRFIIPPFSVFDTKQGYWQDRKKLWHSLGFDSQETREDIEIISKSGQASGIYELRNQMRENLQREPSWDEITAYAKQKKMHLFGGASIFDPVLCEILYKWFCTEHGSVLDPFAGGSVRGIVAHMVGLTYVGIDLREEQVRANQTQGIKLDVGAQWVAGDSNEILDTHFIDSEKFDFVFSCPPYHDLEQYSDDPADLSNMDYDEFCRVYRSIITKSMAKLKQDRFACFVVGDIRDKNGYYRNFIGETIDCFTKCTDDKGDPVHLYNEIILLNVAGSLAVRVGRQFANSRKVGKIHQNVLVFYKGDPKNIKQNFPELKIDILETETEAVELL